MEIIRDWKGNEIKAGMTIYFVQTKPMTIGKFGMLIPDGEGGHSQVWESDEDYDKRANKEIWELGVPYLVIENNGRLYYQTMPDEEGYTLSSPFYESIIREVTIAIKGISDTPSHKVNTNTNG